jgi:hypothetical protein
MHEAEVKKAKYICRPEMLSPRMSSNRIPEGTQQNQQKPE